MAILHRPFSMERWSVLIIRLVILHSIYLSSVLCYESKYHRNSPSFQFVTRGKDNYFDNQQESLSSSPFRFNGDHQQQKKEKIEGKNSQKNFNNNNIVQRAAQLEFQEDDRFKQWNSIDNEQQDNGNPVWSSSPTSASASASVDDNKSKTLPFPSLPTLDILEDPGYNYDHGRPTWPLSEYLTDKFSNLYTRNNKTKDHQNSNYEWQQLKPSSHFGSSTSGSHHNYDTTKFYNSDNYFENKDRYRDNNYRIYNGHAYNNNNGHGHRQSDNNNDIRGHQSGTHTTIVSTTADVTKGGGSNSDSTNRGVTKYGPFGDGYGHGLPYGPYGQPHGAHYYPPDHYPRKRFRLKIHPGYIAAPIAGLAAFGAASVLTNKPLLFELGLVNNKHRYYGHQYPHYPPGHYPQGYPQGHDIHYPGHGWASNIVPVYPHVNPPVAAAIGAHTPQYPILKPDELSSQYHHHGHHNHHHHGHGHHGHHHNHHHSEPEKKPSSWWNPFAALTPRD